MDDRQALQPPALRTRNRHIHSTSPHTQVRSERPPWHLSVICGAALRALGHISSRSAEYLSYLEKGQLPPARISLTTLTEEFVVDGECGRGLAWL